MWLRGYLRLFRCGGAQFGHPVLPRCGVFAGCAGGALAVLAPGGAVYVGDVRNLALLEAFTTGMLCADATAEDTAALMRQRVRQEMCAEQELLVAPEFFAALPQRVPEIAAVDMRLKQMMRSTSSAVTDTRWCWLRRRWRCVLWLICRCCRGIGSRA